MQSGEKKTHESLFFLYKQRLSSLQSLINQLHHLVKDDQIVNTLKDASLEKYRIDRVNEIVLEVLNSEKEKMLITVLEKYDQLNNKIKSIQTKGSKKQDNTVINQELLKRINRMQTELKLKEKQCEIKSKQLFQQSKEIQRLRNQSISSTQDPISHQLHEVSDLKSKLLQSQNEITYRNEIIQKLKNDGQNAVKLLNEKIKKQQAKIEELQNLAQREKQREEFQDKGNKDNKGEKIQLMRRQILFLEEQLTTVQKNFNVIKELALKNTATELKSLKKSHKKLKQYIQSVMETIAEQFGDVQQKILHKFSKVKKNNANVNLEKIFMKVNQIDNQLDYFIENEILTQQQ